MFDYVRKWGVVLIFEELLGFRHGYYLSLDAMKMEVQQTAVSWYCQSLVMYNSETFRQRSSNPRLQCVEPTG